MVVMWSNNDGMEVLRGSYWRRDHNRRQIEICRLYCVICRIRIVNDSYRRVQSTDMDVYEALHLANVVGNWCRVDLYNGSCVVGEGGVGAPTLGSNGGVMA